MKKAFKINQRQTRAAAPAVQGVYILLVKSQQGGDENIASNQSSTNNDHGGSFGYVATFVLGYGGGIGDTATFGGSKLKQTSLQGYDLNQDNIIDGWFEVWDYGSAPNNSSGLFIYTAKSVNIGPSMSTQILIK